MVLTSRTLLGYWRFILFLDVIINISILVFRKIYYFDSEINLKKSNSKINPIDIVCQFVIMKH